MTISIPFDQRDSRARYEIQIRLNDATDGDGIILALDKEACVAFSEMFAQLANASDDEFHLHLGYTEEEPQGPGFRIVVNQNGRI